VESSRERITRIISDVAGGVAAAAPSTEELFHAVYDELRKLARAFMAGERRDHTLQPTALVHEAYLRLVDQSGASWQGRAHFFAVAARVMRNVLVDHARAHGREKRGGGWRRVTLADGVAPWTAGGLDREQLLALDQALEKLARLDEREARIVEMRFFSGLTVAEIAEVLSLSKRTVEADWTHARAWLLRELSGGGER